MIMIVNNTTTECLYINPAQICEIYVAPEGHGYIIMSSGRRLDMNETNMKYIVKKLKTSKQEQA